LKKIGADDVVAGFSSRVIEPLPATVSVDTLRLAGTDVPGGGYGAPLIVERFVISTVPGPTAVIVIPPLASRFILLPPFASISTLPRLSRFTWVVTLLLSKYIPPYSHWRLILLDPSISIFAVVFVANVLILMVLPASILIKDPAFDILDCKPPLGGYNAPFTEDTKSAGVDICTAATSVDTTRSAGITTGGAGGG
jgi:hypothetical protein